MARLIWYGKWVIAATTAVMIALGTFYAFRLTGPLYAATAIVQFDAQSSGIGGLAAQRPTDAARLNTQVSNLTSDGVLRDVIVQLDLLEDPEFNRYLTRPSAFSRSEIRAALRSFLTGTTTLPPTEDEILHKTIQNLRSRLTATRPDGTYLFEVTARSHLADKAMRIANASAQTFVQAQDRAEAARTGATVTWLMGRAANMQAQLARQDRAVMDLMQSVQIHEDTALDRLGSAVLTLAQEQSALQTTLARFEAEAPTARRVAEIDQIKHRIAETQARHDRLQAQLNTQSAGMLALQQMQREADATRILHQSFQARLQEAKIQQALAQPSGRIVTPAAIGTYVGTRKTLILNVSAMVGLVLGVLAVVIQQQMRTGVFHPVQLAQVTGGVVLGQIPARFTRQPSTFLRQLQKHSTSKLHTCVRKIRAGLMMQSNGQCPRVIMITSSGKDEAATPLAIGLANELGGAHGHCTLVITDPAAQETSRYLSALAPDHTFDLIQLNGADDLVSIGFTAQIQALRQDTGHIVILAPAVINAPETLLCAQAADAIVYAVQWGTRPIATIRRGLDLIKASTGKPVGLVLTQTQPRKMRRMAAVSGVPATELGTA